MISDLIKKAFLKYKSPNTILSFKNIELIDIPDDLIKQYIDFRFWKDLKIDEKELFSKQGKKHLLKSLMDDSEKTRLISYEALILGYKLTKEVGIEDKIKIIDFKVHQFGYNNLNCELPNIESLAEQTEEIEDTEHLSIYASSMNMNGETYIQYRDGELLNNAEIVNWFSPNKWEYNTLPVIEEKDIKPKHFIFNYDARDYIYHIRKIVSGGFKKVDILVDNAVKVDTAAMEQVGYVLNYFEQLNIETSLSRIKYDLTKAHRSELNDLLIKHWKSDHFRTLKIYADPDISKETIEISQAEVVETIISEYENGNIHNKEMQDIFLTAPTGAGKSLLFQMPAIYLGHKYNTLSIVVTPLKALMVDQVEQLKMKANYQKVAYINSDITVIQREEILQEIHDGEIDILYLAPELLLSYDISYFLGERKLGLYIVDEAHTVTTWGRDFRVDYWYLGYHISRIRKYAVDSEGNHLKFPVVAVTATAPYGERHDVVFETIKSLQIKSAKKYIGYARRDDIDFDIQHIDITGNLQTQKVALAAKRIFEFENNNKKTIVYCPYTNQVREILRATSKNKTKVYPYYGQLDKETKNKSYQIFKKEEVVTMVSTKAFGMGIDIDNITQIYHLAPTGLLTDYIQEIGRLARRSDLRGTAMVDYSTRDFQFINVLHGLNRTHDWQLREVMRRLIKIYDENKKQNQLITADDFAHIFNVDNPDDLQNDVKNALMLLEKDLNQKHGRIPVLIARPKNLFARVYASISNDQIDDLRKMVSSKAFKLVSYHQLKEHNKSIVVLELDQIWESNFSDKSFGVIKRDFFKNELFKNINLKPKLKISLSINDSKEKILSDINDVFKLLTTAFYRTKGFFSKTDFMIQLVMLGKKKEEATRIADYILPLFSQKRTVVSPNLLKEDVREFSNFLQVKREKESGFFKYRLVNGALDPLKRKIRNTISTQFMGKREISKFVTKDSGQKHLYIKIGQILEVFELGSYEVTGGENPRIFVRINDPFRLRTEAFSNYQNDLLKDISYRHQTGVELMGEFFGSKLNSKERWDFIEEFFLGLKY